MTAMITIGLLRLTDAAPVVVAFEKGFFDRRGLAVQLSVEPSWANIADKLSYGRLQAAVMLPPLAFTIALGTRGIGVPLIVPMALSLNGNSVTIATEIARHLELPPGADAREAGTRLRALVAKRGKRLRLAVVHLYSTHNLLLRYWLAASGIDPERDIEFSVVPPAETADALRDGLIDGFCAGAPWGEVAARAEVGATIVSSSQIWRNHPEKCLA
ncbi:MAG TPA: CmpA/NrtA family ABC transporter substrate-binding protein, partial [Stellaceae bacterium]|nr:CmpA/NrtA family ABC transporter substrate-binding protein [Stellaceae bacterium]